MRDFVAGEVLLLDKPLGWTSFDVVNKVRYALKKNLGIKKIKVGHTGTLDPLATGLLILCTGKFTKRIPEFLGQDKSYEGTFHLGATTPTLDLESEPDTFFPTDSLTDDAIREAAKTLTGPIMQVPPIFSAKKVDGTVAYHAARKGETIDLPPQAVVVRRFELTRFSLPEVDFDITCSKGTYIRALARDLGKGLNNGAYLSRLHRTQVGDYHVRDAQSLDDFLAQLSADSPSQTDA